MDSKILLRQLPSVDGVLTHLGTTNVLSDIPRQAVVDAIREVLDSSRISIVSGQIVDSSIETIAALAVTLATKKFTLSLRRAVNATGIILHTGLGRAVLSQKAVEELTNIAQGHSTLEIDVDTGKRGSRHAHIEQLLCRLTGSEAAMAVNNNAAAVFLAVNTLADGKEVIISRGQLVEIGGQFRVPDIIQRAGCRMVEVGTTNRTRISDYADAITADTALILRVHPSNFAIVGYTEEPSVAELSELGKAHAIPVMDDLGSGSLIDVAQFGLKHEETVQDSVKAGADISTFSGDKLLGGPQAGLIVGRREFVDLCKKSPIARIVRMDKLTLAALEATLRLYMDPAQAITDIPTLRYMSRSVESLGTIAGDLAESLREIFTWGWHIEVVDTVSQVGGGSLPGENLPSKAVTLKSDAYSADDLVTYFRQHRTPVFGRVEDDWLLLDVRTVEPVDIQIIIDCARDVAGKENK